MSAKLPWKVKFEDREDGVQTASFKTQQEAGTWIDTQEDHERYDPVGFKVIDGPYEDKAGVSESSRAKDVVKKIESKEDAQQYVEDFKDYFGYKDGYHPRDSAKKVADWLAHECTLQMPTDTAAREVEGDAVILLVLSGDKDAIAAGKKLGDCMMRITKHTDNLLLKHMREAYLKLLEIANKQQLSESAGKVNIWIDDIRPAPRGYFHLMSTNQFIDFAQQHGIDSIGLVDLDHDAGDYQKDGGDYIHILDWLESIGAEDIDVHFHSANPVGVQNMRRIVQKNGWREVDGTFESRAVEEVFANQLRPMNESWKPEYDDKPVNQWGEKWTKLPNSHYVVGHIDDVADDCQIDPSTRGPKIDNLNVSSVHAFSDGRLLVTVFGGANGGEMPGECSFKLYLALVKKFINKLLDGHSDDQMFEDAWLVDWDNDCCDDVWTLRFCLTFTKDQLAHFKECTDLPIEDGSLEQANESIDGAKPFNETAFLAAARENGIDCTSAEQNKPSKHFPVSTSITVYGSFPDRIPCDYLIFNWKPETDEYAKRGWYQGIRCMNKWNGIIIDKVLRKLYPDGIASIKLD